MLQAFILFSDGRAATGNDVPLLTAAVADARSRYWVDIEDPTPAEYALLRDVFHFHPLAIEDTMQHVQRPKVEGYRFDADVDAAPARSTDDADRDGSGDVEIPADPGADYFYLVVHAPDLASFRSHECHEIDVFMSDRFLVTVHDHPVASITARRDRCRADPHLALDPGMDRLLHNLLDHVVDEYQPILDSLDTALEDLEDRALNEPTPAVLGEIADKKRELLYLRQIAGPQREVVAQLTRGEVPFIRESTRVYLRDVQDHLIRVHETVELYRDIVLGARDIYLSSVSNQLNQIMKTLTIISVIGLPLTVVTGFFGMNFDALPGIHNATTFWVAVVVMAVAVVAMLWIFHRKRWI